MSYMQISPSRMIRFSCIEMYHGISENHRLLNKPPNEAAPPPPLSCRLASLRIQSIRNCLSASFLASMTFVSARASPASKLSSVGVDVIEYREASGMGVDIISGVSNCTGAKSTPPSCSPTPEETRLRRSGSMVRQDGHQAVLHSVRRGIPREVERES